MRQIVAFKPALADTPSAASPSGKQVVAGSRIATSPRHLRPRRHIVANRTTNNAKGRCHRGKRGPTAISDCAAYQKMTRKRTAPYNRQKMERTGMASEVTAISAR